MVTTENELKLIAKAAIIGNSNQPVKGYNNPAAPGENIPSEHLPRLFDWFYRIDSSSQKSSDGAGLGLAITKSIINGPSWGY